MDEMCSAKQDLRHTKIIWIVALLITLFLLSMIACNMPRSGNNQDDQQLDSSNVSNFSSHANTGTIATGEGTVLLVEQVGPEGGTLVVDMPGDPLNGFTIQIPAGAYPDGVTFEIASHPITDHTFGPDLNPASPLIKIKADEILAQGFIIVDIPVQVEPGEFGMAFSYEDQKGIVEGLPILASGNNGVRFATRDISREVIVSTVKLDRLNEDIDTGFQHGIDDWQFANYGSVLAPKGHCAGQSLSAMYYYIENLGPPLYGQYDNYDNAYVETPGMQWDDEQAYRLASVAQETVDWDGAGRWFWELYADEHLNPGVYNAFAYSMLLTNAPQFVGIYNEKGSGHAMIVYGKRGNTLLISDPNYPYNSVGGREERYITFNTESGLFDPYYSGPNAADKEDPYDTILYFGYKDIIDWKALGVLWEELEVGVVGGDQFPRYRLMVRDSDSDIEEELWNNHETDHQEIVVHIEASFSPHLFVYNAEAKTLTDSSKPIPLTLQEGENMLGFEINALDESGEPKWVGFDWIKIIYEGADAGSTLKDEMYYEGTYTHNHTPSGCIMSGDFEFYAYSSGSVAARYRKTEDSCVDEKAFWPWNHVNGTHEDGSFKLLFNANFAVEGTFSADSMSCSSPDGTWSASAVRMP